MKTLVLLAIALPVGAYAQAPAANPSAKPVELAQVAKGDPNRMVCRSEDTIGSRLRRQKRCMTAQEWYDLHLDDRRALERVQGGGWKSN